MEVFRQEFRAFWLRPVFDVARESIGDKRIRALLEEFGVTEDELADPSAWVSLEFSEAICDRLSTLVADPALLDRAGRLAFEAKYLGPMRPLLRLFSSPSHAFSTLVEQLPRFNKVGQVRIVEREQVADRHRIVLEFTPRPGAPHEAGPHICAGRRGQVAAVPTLFDFAPASVEHPKCMCRGDEGCVYEATWYEPTSRLPSRIALALAVSASMVVAVVQPPLMTILAVFFGAATLWAITLVIEQRRRLAQRVRELGEQHDALLRFTQTNEERYGELLEAKASVDAQVQTRTAELAKTSARLEETLEEVRALAETRQRLFANVSHDLKTPLQLVIGPIEGLRSATDPEERTVLLERMQRNANRVLERLDRMLSLARADEHRLVGRRRSTDVGALVHEILLEHQGAADSKDVELECVVPDTPVVYEADYGWIESAIGNLVSNAIRVVPNGSRVAVRLADGPAGIAIEVEDDGPGIEPEDQKRIFTRFEQGDGRGTAGLGLAIVREAARLHGGEVSLESEPGKGTLFRVELPRRPAERGGSSPHGTGAERSGPHDDAPLVLLVEDEPEVRTFVADVLAKRYRVVLANDGREGLALGRSRGPEAIVSDVAMPNMDGYDLCRAVRADPALGSTPVILLTAHDEPRDVIEGFEAGASDYVTKPCQPRELLARVDVHVQMRLLSRRIAHRERLSSLGFLAASLAHQIRNPLGGIINGASLVQQQLEAGDTSKAGPLLTMMADCGRRLSELTSQLLVLGQENTSDAVDFSPLQGLTAAIDLFDQAPDSETSFRRTLSIDDDVLVHGHPTELNHVLVNLLDNAVRAAGADGTVQVDCRRDGDAVVIDVADSGPGLGDVDPETLFRPFFTTRGVGEGTGLGLYIAQSVVDRHGGTLTTGTSDLGGARFTVRLPTAGAG